MELGGEGRAVIAAQLRKFEERFGRPPGPDDPIFFDPDSDEPRPFSPLDVESEMVALLEAAGISAAWIYAYQHTDGLLPRADGSFMSESDKAEWDEAVGRYVNLHQPGVRVDHDNETRKLRDILAATTLHMVAADAEYATSLARGLGVPATTGDDEALMRPYLQALAVDLLDELRSDPAIVSAAFEYARAWVGADLANRVREAAEGSLGADCGLDILLVVATAVGSRGLNSAGGGGR